LKRRRRAVAYKVGRIAVEVRRAPERPLFQLSCPEAVRPATRDWPEAYTTLTIEANDDVAPFHDRQIAVLRRDQRMAWLDRTCLEEELLRPLPAGTFVVSQPRTGGARILNQKPELRDLAGHPTLPL